MNTRNEYPKSGTRNVSRGGPEAFENNNFTELCSASEAGLYSRLIDFVFHSTLGLRGIKKRDEQGPRNTVNREA